MDLVKRNLKGFYKYSVNDLISISFFVKSSFSQARLKGLSYLIFGHMAFNFLVPFCIILGEKMFQIYPNCLNLCELHI